MPQQGQGRAAAAAAAVIGSGCGCGIRLVLSSGAVGDGRCNAERVRAVQRRGGIRKAKGEEEEQKRRKTEGMRQWV